MKKKGWSLAHWLKGKSKMEAKDWLLIIVMIIGVLFALLLLGRLIWNTYHQKKINHLLPDAETTAYFELEDLNSPPSFNRDFLMGLKSVNELFKVKYGLDLEALKPYFNQGKLGLAFIQNNKKESDPVIFFKVHSPKKALAYFKSIGLENEEWIVDKDKGGFIYSYSKSRPFSFGFFGSYAFVSESIEALSIIRSVHMGEVPYLNQRLSYQKSSSHLPRNAWLKSVINFQEISFSNYPPYDQILNPLKNLVDHLNVTVRKKTNGLHFNTLLSIQPEDLIQSTPTEASAQFSYALAHYILADPLAIYIGGLNLAQEWQSTLKTISHFNPSYGIILEGLVRAQFNRLFGKDISLRDDLYPLFEDEYAFLIENRKDNQATHPLGLKLILKHSDAEFTTIKLKKLAEGFRFLGAQFSPKLKTFVLPDNTESRELIADNNNLEEVKEDYKKTMINCLVIKDSVYQFCYAITDELVFISNHLESIKESIDLIDHDNLSLAQNENFRKTLSQLSKISDEISFIRFNPLNELLKNTKMGSALIGLPKSFETAGWVKHYFDDGVSTEGFIMLK